METILESKNHLATYILDNGIVYATFHRGVRLKLDDAKFLLEERLKFIGNKSYPTIIDMRGLKSMDKETRDFLGQDKAAVGITAGALVIDSFISKVIGNIFLKFYTPPRPTKMFHSVEEAEEWLQQYKNL